MVNGRDYMRRPVTPPDDDVTYGMMCRRMRDVLAEFLDGHVATAAGEVALLADATLQVVNAATAAARLDEIAATDESE